MVSISKGPGMFAVKFCGLAYISLTSVTWYSSFKDLLSSSMDRLLHVTLVVASTKTC